MNKELVRLAISPIGWTNDDMPELGQENTFQQSVSEMALAGFSGTETGSKFSRDPQVLKPALDLRGIQICNAWFSTFFAEGRRQETLHEFDQTLKFLHNMGAKVIGCSEQSFSNQGKAVPMYQGKPVFSDEQWLTIGTGYNELASRAASKGMTVCLHHHMCTGIETPEEIERFMSPVVPEVFLLFDTGHLYAATHSQQQIIAVLEKYLPRIGHVHLKDCRPQILQETKTYHRSFLDGVRAGIFTVPGDGVIDFEPVFALLDKQGYRGWMVVEAEQDPAKANPLEYAIKARKFIRQMTGL